MRVVDSCARAKIFKIVLYEQNDPKKGVHLCAQKFENQLEHASFPKEK